MASDAIHELKNQLGIIAGFTELLLTEVPEGDRRRNDLLEIHKSVIRALELVPRLVERGTTDPSVQPAAARADDAPI